MPFFYCRRGLLAAVFLALILGGPGPGLAQEQKPQSLEKATAPAATPEVLPRVLAEGAGTLEKEAGVLKTKAAAAQKDWAQVEKDSQERKAAVATLKAALAVTSLPLIQAEEAIKTYSQQEEKLGSRLLELTKETEVLKKEQAAREASQTALQAEVTRLKAARHPATRSREMQQSYQRFQSAAASARQAAGQLLESLEKETRLLEGEKKLVSEVRADLQTYADAAWKAELLKRQEQLSLSDEISRVGEILKALPYRGWRQLGELRASGALGEFFQGHLAPLIGLLALLVLLVWGVHRLSALATLLLASWQAQARTLGLQAALSLGEVISSHFFLLAAIFWVWLCLWSLGLLEVPAGRVFLYLLLTLGGLRLGRHWLRQAFAGKEACGLLPLENITARFYRRYLQLLLIYLGLGVWGLTSAEFLGFPPASRQFLGHVFRLGLLGWAMWLLRRRYLERLLPQIPGPGWLKRPGVIRSLRGLVLLLLTAIIFADLLGFQNLADYLAQAGAFTGLALLFLGLLWLGLDTVLTHLLHPKVGWVKRRYPHREEMVQRLHGLTRGGLTAILAVAALLLAMKAWGLEPASLAWAYQWLTWGPILGSVRLTPLSLGAAALALYLGIWFSRLARGLMELRVYPRTGWDSGIQYTISTTLHYAILVLGILAALNLLGFPLTNLALLAGALGVGIGFGLQNIVNNFISGLILLFERPIKVGDLLVIDGQWGTVKEIRVRSTIFETSDRYVLIIPNAELLSGKIINWTHYGWGPNRLELKVGVGCDSDVQQVTRVVSELCLANPRVLRDPPPQVYFKAYGDNSLDFIIWVFLQSPKDRVPATHELNSAILEAFKKEGIEMPSPQRELYIKNWPGGLGKGGDW